MLWKGFLVGLAVYCKAAHFWVTGGIVQSSSVSSLLSLIIQSFVLRFCYIFSSYYIFIVLFWVSSYWRLCWDVVWPTVWAGLGFCYICTFYALLKIGHQLHPGRMVSLTFEFSSGQKKKPWRKTRVKHNEMGLQGHQWETGELPYIGILVYLHGPLFYP
jgi:hypothetical protein